MTSSKHHFHPGHVLYSKIRPYLAKSVVVDFEGLCSADMYPVEATGIDRRYLHRWLVSPEFTEAASRSQGRTVLPKINQKALRGMPVPVPPERQQAAIANRIEILLARSRRAKEALDAIPPLLERFRQSVLAAAFRGDLTADWRAQNPDVEPADQLLERIRTERRRRWEDDYLAKQRAKGKEPRNDKWKSKYKEPSLSMRADLPTLPDTWGWYPLQIVADVIDPNPSHRNPPYVAEGFPFVTTAEFTEPEGVELETRRRVAEPTVVEQEERCSFSAASILFSRKGTIGKTRMLPAGRRLAVLDSLCVVNPATDLLPPFLNYALRSPPVVRQVTKATRGVALKQVSVGRVRKLWVPMAPAAEQQVVASRIGDLVRAAHRLGESFAAATLATEKLDRAVLSSAFAGRLVE